MSNKRITDLTELTNPTTDDVFPVVDIASNTTTKVQLGNLPVSSPVTTALATKQNTLVSGVTIKTVNSQSLLGAGDIPIPIVNPSGVAGAIQFSNGSAFASDASNLFWDDTNNRLGVGTNAPSALLNVQNSTNGEVLARFKDNISAQTFLDIKTDSTLTDYTALYFGSDRRIMSKQGGALFLNLDNNINFIEGLATKMTMTPTEVRIGSISGARLGIRGTGTTSGTTSLLVQNSAGTQGLKIDDALGFQIGGLGASGIGTSIRTDSGGGGINAGINTNFNNGATWIDDTNTRAMQIPYNGGVLFANTTRYPITLGAATKAVASAQLEMISTSQGFLPPRMTTTQKNAIASPAAGLVLYDSTTNKLCCYNGSTWNDLF
jgi:hypothetical protein